MKIRIRQSYYSIFHKPFLLKGFTPYFNPVASPFMENQILADLLACRDHDGHDYYGLVSWRFEEKTKKNFEQIREAVLRDKSHRDVYGFPCHDLGWVGAGENIWRVAYPRQMVVIARKILARLGYSADPLALKAPIIYCNFWIAKPCFFERYLKEMLIPAMKLINEDEEIRQLCDQDSEYKTFPIRKDYKKLFYQKKSLSKKRCLQIFGKPYYPYHPFVCERLFSTWLGLNPSIRALLV